jgi:hypothetical protein
MKVEFRLIFFHHVAPTKKMGFYNLAGYPKIDGFERNILLKWMIWRYPHSGNLHIMVNIYISKKTMVNIPTSIIIIIIFP